MVSALKACAEAKPLEVEKKEAEKIKLEAKDSVGNEEECEKLLVITALKKLQKDNKIAFGEVAQICRSEYFISIHRTVRDYLNDEDYTFLDSSGKMRLSIKKIIASCITGEPGNVTIVEPA